MQKTNLVVGLGEIGNPTFKLISRVTPTIGYDINYKLMKKEIDFQKLNVLIMHICIPFTSNFLKNVNSLYKKFQPELLVIHSTVSPNTTKILQKKIKIPIIYSPTRGVHKRMTSDIKKYTKFYALENNAPKKKWASQTFSRLLKKCGIKTKKMSKPVTLELAKIVVDTSYYGWLINYAQLSNMIAKKHNVDYDEMWSFADEIQKYLGNRPKMFPGFIGGHCVIPNLDLISNKTLDLIKEINLDYSKILSKRTKKG